METPVMEQKRNKTDQLCGKLREAYAKPFAAAQEQEKFTATAGWQNNFAKFVKDRDAARLEFAERLGVLASAACHGFGDDDRKALKDIAKESEASELMVQHYLRRMVHPLEAVADACSTCIENFRRQAREMADHEPMFAGQVVSEMDSAIAELPKVQWDGKEGRIVIID